MKMIFQKSHVEDKYFTCDIIEWSKHDIQQNFSSPFEVNFCIDSKNSLPIVYGNLCLNKVKINIWTRMYFKVSEVKSLTKI